MNKIILCPTCQAYLVRLAAAVNDPTRNPIPSTEEQVKHERKMHGGPAAYYRKLN